MSFPLHTSQPFVGNYRRREHARTARSFLLTILGEYVYALGGSVWTEALIAALEQMGVQEKASRQAITRHAARGWLKRERVGRRARWHLTPASVDLLKRGAHRIYTFEPVREDWDRHWLILMTNTSERHRHFRHRLQRQLAWAGFGFLRQGIWVSPDTRNEEDVRLILSDLGGDVQVISFVAQQGSIGDDKDILAQAWNLPMLKMRYDKFVKEFQSQRPRTPEETFAALTHLVHEWRIFPTIDPGLPLLPRDWSGRTARDLFHSRRLEWRPIAEDWFANLKRGQA